MSGEGVVVPREPTVEMERAGNAADARYSNNDFRGNGQLSRAAFVYKAMLSAAPAAPPHELVKEIDASADELHALREDRRSLNAMATLLAKARKERDDMRNLLSDAHDFITEYEDQRVESEKK